MNNSNEELSEALKNMQPHTTGGAKYIDLEDEIDFKCNRCGACCMNRDDIIMNPYDIYNIALVKNITPIEAITNYCHVHIGKNSCLPIVTLKSDERNMCPFLKFYIAEGKFGCSINNNKPGACLNHPIGVVRQTTKNNSFEIKEENKFIMVEPCPNHSTGSPVKVKEFISDYLDNMSAHDMGSELQFRILKYINAEKLVRTFIFSDEKYIETLDENERANVKGIKETETKILEILPTAYVSAYFESAYNFDMSKPFLEQKDAIDLEIQKAAVKLITSTLILGIDILNPDVNFEEMAEEARKEMDEFIKNTKEAIEEWQQEQ